MNDPNNPPPYEGAAGGIVGAAMRAKARKRARLAKEAQGQEQVHEIIADGNFGVLTPKQVALFLGDVNGGKPPSLEEVLMFLSEFPGATEEGLPPQQLAHAKSTWTQLHPDIDNDVKMCGCRCSIS